MILQRATVLASTLGLDGVTIGKLADELKLSKSGLFAHFRSKESLQMEVLKTSAEHFSEVVIRPAVKSPRGLPRITELFERWIKWAKGTRMSGGCIFITAAIELDDKPGPVRNLLVQIQKEWQDTRTRIVETGVSEGHFKADLDCDQFAFDLYGIMFAYHHAARLMRDPQAEQKARNAFAALIAQAQTSQISKKRN